MELEKITKNEFKPSFMKRMRNSVANKIIMLATAGTLAFSACGGRDMNANSCFDDYDCPGQELCVDGSCNGESNSCYDDWDCPGDEICTSGVCIGDNNNNNNNNITEINMGGVPIKTGKTNSSGQIQFTDYQTGEGVNINVRNENGSAISNAPVTFFDGNEFEAFVVNDPDYAPSLTVFAHNSGHDLSLTVAPWEAKSYTGSSNNNSVEAAEKFSEYVKNNSQPTGCELADEIKADSEARAIGLAEICDDYANTHGICDGVKKFAGWGFKAIDAFTDGLSYLAEAAGVNANNCVAYKTWSNSDVSQWNVGPSLSLRIDSCMSEVPPENCSNGIDDDCDHKIDGADSDCQGTECYSHDHQTCHNGDVYWVDSCGSFESVADNCNSNETCQNGNCVDDGPTCTSHDHKTCGGGNAYWVDSCGVVEEMADNCHNYEEICQNGICIPNGTGNGDYCDPCDVENNTGCITGWNCGGWQGTDITFCHPAAYCNLDSNCEENYVCHPNANVCTPSQELVCKSGDVWAQDSCGNWIVMTEDCGNNETCYNGNCVEDGPTCYSHDHKTCSGGDAYWVDSCGSLEEMADNCGSDETCQNGVCVEDTVLHYEMLGDGTVLDTWTGNIWQLNPPSSKMKWYDANNYCENLTLGGSSNWSLPSANNLLEIKVITLITF